MSDSNAPTPVTEAIPGKEPWMAVCLSRILPGIGQIYSGTPVRGCLILLLYLGVSIAALYCFIGPTLRLGPGIILILLIITISVWSLFDAYGSTRRRNSSEFESVRLSGKDPWRSVFFTSLFLGLGHLYIRRYGWAAVLIALGVVSTGIPLLWLLGLVLTPIALCHSYWATPAGRSQPKGFAQGAKIILIAWLLPFIAAGLLAGGIRGFVAEARYIPSGAMQPTLEINDRLIINKLTYRSQPPKRGDIVVFSPTEALREQDFADAFIKRIIGLPGETVEVRDGQVFIDGEALDEDYTLEKPDYQWGPQEVPNESYFVLGDNRNNSYDSHYWGFVPRENIIGQATQRFWPWDRKGAVE